jgi:RNase P subunit RPR2
MRRLFCRDCGKPKPTHPEDAARGLFSRYRHGVLTRSIVCDHCDKELLPGDAAVAMSQPNDMREWEHEYMELP